MGNEYNYEWDEAKRLSNLAKHGVDFISIVEIDWEKSLFHTQMVNGEERVLAYAPIYTRLYAIVFVAKFDAIRIISFRKANRREVKRYAEEI